MRAKTLSPPAPTRDSGPAVIGDGACGSTTSRAASAAVNPDGFPPEPASAAARIPFRFAAVGA